jgi:glycosyltransferase involved in cell wall biosynthesis
MRLSVVMATIARPTIKQTLESIGPQLTADDELIIVQDAAALTLALPAKVYMQCLAPIRLTAFGPTHHWGNEQRQHGISLATGDFIVFADDDDIWLPMTRRIIEHDVRKPVPHFFKMRDPNGLNIWVMPELTQGNVGGPMAVFPNIPSMIGSYSDRYEGDYDFFRSWKWTDDQLVWIPKLIYVCRP